MKALKFTLVITALAVAPFFARAQEKPNRPHKEQHQNMVKALNLNKKQANQLKVIHESYKAEKKVIQNKMPPIKKELKSLKSKKKALKKAEMKEIETILTREQFVQFQEMMQRKKEHRKKKHKKD
jgi:Spy/CpxP family protein refolding chaperone